MSVVKRIGVIGGSGLYAIDGLEFVRSVSQKFMYTC